MKKERPNRRSIRLQGYDYTQPGAYFVTICTHLRKCMFGWVHGGVVVLTALGSLAQEFWRELPEHIPNVDIDVFIVMPNHLHGIVRIKDASRRGTKFRAPTERFGKPVQGSLSTIVRTYKSALTRQWRREIHDQGYVVWQRNYYERVIRNDRELNAIRRYIQENPRRWEVDPYHVA